MPSPVATIREIAKRSGYSIATVSRVLNQSPLASPTAVRKVNAAASALGYTPNFSARLLKGGSSKIIGFFTQELSSLIDRKLIEGIERVARERGYSVLVYLFLADETDTEGCLRILQQPLFEGVIVGMEVSQGLRNTLQMHQRIVWADRWPDRDADAVVVTSDHGQACSLMLRHFLARGAQHLVYYGMGGRNPVEKSRFDGLRRVSAESDLDFVHFRNDPAAFEAYAVRADAASGLHAVVFEPTLPGDPESPVWSPPPGLRPFLARSVGGFYDLPAGSLHLVKTLPHGISILQDHAAMGVASCGLLLQMIEGAPCPPFTRVPVTSVEF